MQEGMKKINLCKLPTLWQAFDIYYWIIPRSSVAQWVKDLTLSLKQLGSLPWCRFDPRPQGTSTCHRRAPPQSPWNSYCLFWTNCQGPERLSNVPARTATSNLNFVSFQSVYVLVIHTTATGIGCFHLSLWNLIMRTTVCRVCCACSKPLMSGGGQCELIYTMGKLLMIVSLVS